MNTWVQLASMILAQSGEAPPAGPPGGGLLGMLPVLAMVLLLWLLVMRPASKQRREHQELLNALKKDDEIITNGGLLGRIVSIDEKVAVVEVADKVKIRILRDRIQGRWAAEKKATR